MKHRSVLCTITGMAALVLAGLPHAADAQDSYSISGSHIYKNGAEFIPVGCNLNGPNWVWLGGIANDTILNAAKAWNFNTVRVNTYIDSSHAVNGQGQQMPTYGNDSLDDIVNKFTPQGIVVMVEAHDGAIGPSGYPDDNYLHGQLRDYWVNLANKYKNNPSVWFNLMNEPGTHGGQVDSRWLDVHSYLIDQIRATGANNVIVCDGASWGQESGGNYSGDVPTSNSAILSYGQTLSQNRSNILYSLHIYDQWGENSGNLSTYETKLSHYIDAVHNAGLPLVIGETGDFGNHDTPGSYTDFGVINAFDVVPTKGVGIIAWHGTPGDGFNMVSEPGTYSGGFDRLQPNSTNPTDLTWWGQKMWNYSHSVQQGMPNLLTNPGFETGDFTGWGQWSNNGQFNGGLSDAQAGANPHGGRYNMYHYGVNAYQQYTYQSLNVPNGNYTLSAWACAGGVNACYIGVKNFGGNEVVSPWITNSNWQQYTVPTVTVTNGHIEVFLWTDAQAGGWSAADDFVLVDPPAVTGKLSGAYAASSGTVNLTSLGARDWAHWGLSSATSFNHKSGANQISGFTKVGSGTVARYASNGVGYTWTGGSPTASATNTVTGVYVPGVGNGFTFTAPADTTQRVLKVYVGLWQAGGKLTAHLSDGSAADFVDTSLSNGSGTSNRVYTLTYKAAKAGQTLKVTWTQASGTGNVTLQAAALQ